MLGPAAPAAPNLYSSSLDCTALVGRVPRRNSSKRSSDDLQRDEWQEREAAVDQREESRSI